MRNLTEIIVHCTATRPEWMVSRPLLEKVEEIRRWHVEGNGWRDIGYHYLIDRNGAIIVGRPIEQQGAHVRGRNATSIGISLLGGHGSSETDHFDDNFTADQDAALRALIGELQSKYGRMSVVGHNQFAAKACPGFMVPDWYNAGAVNRKYIPEDVEKTIEDADKLPRQSKTNWAALMAGTTSVWQGVQSADWKVQIAAIVGVAFCVFIIFDRNRKSKLARQAKAALGLT